MYTTVVCVVLNVNGLRINSVLGDGNCLFRSVSDLIYGTDEHYDLVRQRALDYMVDEQEFFQDYVEGDEVRLHYYPSRTVTRL